MDKSIYLYFANLTSYYFYRIQCIFQFSTYLLCLEHDFTNIIMFLSTKEYYSWRCPIWFFQNNVIKWKSTKFNRRDKWEFILEFFLGFPACDFRPLAENVLAWRHQRTMYPHCTKGKTLISRVHVNFHQDSSS